MALYSLKIETENKKTLLNWDLCNTKYIYSQYGNSYFILNSASGCGMSKP